MPKPPTAPVPVRHLVLVLGDQLNRGSAAFDGFDRAQDAVWMAEVAHESTKVWSHQARIAVFLAAMRHFRDSRRSEGWRVIYRELTAEDAAKENGKGQKAKGGTGGDAPAVDSAIHNPPSAIAETFTAQLTASLAALRPQRLLVVEPGEWGVREELRTAARAAGVPIEERPDRHFLTSIGDLARHAAGRKQLRLEFFYRELRKRTGLLMDGDAPAGGAWNYDAENRRSFGKAGPGRLPAPRRFLPDATTRAVLDLVAARFAGHPGRLEHFDWPVTPADAQAALEDFIAHRLPDFGTYQDAMWTGEPWLYHSRLSVALNLKLLDPRDVLAAAERAYRAGRAPLAAAEGFIRQILGWREYVRGIYWHFMPAYAALNELDATQPLPRFYWTGDTEMNCLRHAIGQTLEYGYAHHIQRLMVTGLFALLLGVRPQAVHEWYLAVYVDAVEWVELPNTLGMSQHGDGGLMASKPYVASGRYIQRMSNYCAGCRYDPAASTGPRACPFTTLYWDFLQRHEARLRKNQRMDLQVRNLDRLAPAQRVAIRQQAEEVRARCAAG
ncbi:MAG: cryptochrome/photolyase family protein [Limisphaerales bacterium]